MYNKLYTCTYNHEMKKKKKYYKANDSITAAHAHFSSSILQKKQNVSPESGNWNKALRRE